MEHRLAPTKNRVNESVSRRAAKGSSVMSARIIELAAFRACRSDEAESAPQQSKANGANRFHFVGGSRFVHGGAMPQEIAVPVIRVQHVKDSGKAAKTKTRTVGVSVLGSNFKVTTNRHRFQLIQTEPVGERVKPITLKVGIYDGDDPVTNVETVTFDSTSTDMNQWKKTVSLTLEGRRFDSKKIEIITPSDPDQRGCQLSVAVRGSDKRLFHRIHELGVITDWREPDVIRVAPTPFYNGFEEVYDFVQILKGALNE